jgi:single-strand DNA-binding protein
MSQGGYVTLVGFMAQDPRQRQVRDGILVTDLRVGATTRVQDRVTNEWRDGDTSYFDVSCWRRLSDHARASLHKGDPVFIKGRIRSRTFTDKNGQVRTVIDIIADTVGHDLNRGVANYLGRQRPPVTADGDRAPVVPAVPDVPEDGDMIDEEAIERFGRELDDLGGAELAPGALTEEEEDPAAEAADTAVPSASPF